MTETLIIVHLSSMGSYAYYYGSKPAKQLAEDIKQAILTHEGPVIIMDQEDSELEAQDLRSFVLETLRLENVQLFHHDEMRDPDPWRKGMRQLMALVKFLQTDRVRLGGLWASESGKSGCVHGVQRKLKREKIPCYLDSNICALEENDRRVLANR